MFLGQKQVTNSYNLHVLQNYKHTHVKHTTQLMNAPCKTFFIISRHAYEVSEAGIVIDLFILIILIILIIILIIILQEPKSCCACISRTAWSWTLIFLLLLYFLSFLLFLVFVHCVPMTMIFVSWIFYTLFFFQTPAVFLETVFQLVAYYSILYCCVVLVLIVVVFYTIVKINFI